MDKLEGIFGNVWFFHVVLEEGQEKGKHKHEHDHIHLAQKGEATITCYNEDGSVMYTKTVREGGIYRVPKNHIHQITATNGFYSGFCLHAVRDENDEVIDTNMIEKINQGDIEIIKPYKPEGCGGCPEGE